MVNQTVKHPETASGSARGSKRDAATADLVVVANRLPVQHSSKNGTDGWRPSPGGLVSALTSVLQNRNGLWIGWLGTSEVKNAPLTYEGIRLKSVDISREEYDD